MKTNVLHGAQHISDQVTSEVRLVDKRVGTIGLGIAAVVAACASLDISTGELQVSVVKRFGGRSQRSNFCSKIGHTNYTTYEPLSSIVVPSIRGTHDDPAFVEAWIVLAWLPTLQCTSDADP